MKISIVINILNSHEIVRRQILHFKKMNLPDDVEIIFVDDGSTPPLWFPDNGLRNFQIHATNDKRPWTCGLARNAGARLAKGEYLFMTDIDHIISRETIDAILSFKEDKMVFQRHIAILDENGDIVQDRKVLLNFGYNKERLLRRGLVTTGHGNTFAIRKTIFDEIGGYDEKRSSSFFHAGEDRLFNKRWDHLVRKGKYKLVTFGPVIYMFPVGKYCGDGTNIDYNPFGLFCDLKRKEIPQPMLE